MGGATAIEASAAGAAPWTLRRVVTAGVIGNVLEWYDFAVYGFFAPILAAQFFPAEDPQVTLLISVDRPPFDTGDRFGGTAAAPLFGELAPAIVHELGIQPSVTANSCAPAGCGPAGAAPAPAPAEGGEETAPAPAPPAEPEAYFPSRIREQQTQKSQRRGLSNLFGLVR